MLKRKREERFLAKREVTKGKKRKTVEGAKIGKEAGMATRRSARIGKKADFVVKASSSGNDKEAEEEKGRVKLGKRRRKDAAEADKEGRTSSKRRMKAGGRNDKEEEEEETDLGCTESRKNEGNADRKKGSKNSTKTGTYYMYSSEYNKFLGRAMAQWLEAPSRKRVVPCKD